MKTFIIAAGSALIGGIIGVHAFMTGYYILAATDDEFRAKEIKKLSDLNTPA